MSYEKEIISKLEQLIEKSDNLQNTEFGGECVCHAYGKCECACGAYWEDDALNDLFEEINKLKKELDRNKNNIRSEKIASTQGMDIYKVNLTKEEKEGLAGKKKDEDSNH